MIESALQILLILAYLAIGLLSVTFPIYAICVSYLRTEKHEAHFGKKKELEIVNEKIASLTLKKNSSKTEEDLKQITTEITKYEKKRKKLEAHGESLTARHAVLYPTLLLLMGLAFSILGIIVLDNEQPPFDIVVGLGSVSAFWITLALGSLYATIKKIELASLRSRKTIDFNVVFKSKQKTVQIIKGKVKRIDVGVLCSEYIDRFCLRLFLSPQIEVKSARGARITLQPKGFLYEGYTLLSYERDCLTTGAYTAFNLEVISNKVGEYRIPVHIDGKGIHRYTTNLFVSVKK